MENVVAAARHVLSSYPRRGSLNRSIQKLQYRLEGKDLELKLVLEDRMIAMKEIEKMKKELAELEGNMSENELVDDE